MGKESDEIKKHIDEKREQLGETLDQLEQKVRSATDWRAIFHRHSTALLAAAFGTGLLLSLSLGSDRRD